MLKFKSHCPNCGSEVVVDVLHGRIQTPCGHQLRVKAKLNGWICCIFAFFLSTTITKFTHQYFGKIPMGPVLELAVALLLVVITVSILYRIFGFDNVYRLEEKK